MAIRRRPQVAQSRREVIGGAVTRQEWNDIAAAFNQARFRTMSDGIRTLALAFVNLPRVRDAVAAWRDGDGAVQLGIKPIKQDQGVA